MAVSNLDMHALFVLGDLRAKLVKQFQSRFVYITEQTPEGIYLTSIRQNGRTVQVSGMAQTNERVSEFLRNTGGRSTWLERPELVEIKASNQATKDARAAKRLFEFTMRVSLKQPATEESEASRPRGAGKPPAKPAGQS